MAAIKTTHVFPAGETSAQHIGGEKCECQPQRFTKAVGPRRVNTEVRYVHNSKEA